jgi:subtilisin family serine protease
MRTGRAVAAVAALPLAWLVAERVRGPAVAPLPDRLPHIARRPAPWAGTPPSLDRPPVPLAYAGLTGRHVGIAMVDNLLLADHQEYADRLRWYEEIDAGDGRAGWHSTAVASIAAGKTVGVAPEADLYFVGAGQIYAREPLGDWFVAARRAAHSGQTVGLAIRRILEMNRRLPEGRKIRVISMSIGAAPLPWLDDTPAAVAEARRQGLFVSWIDLPFLKPLGPVRIASAAGPDRYVTAGPAGSWAIAYWAGRYALACQQDPSMTPERFLTSFRAGRSR